MCIIEVFVGRKCVYVRVVFVSAGKKGFEGFEGGGEDSSTS